MSGKKVIIELRNLHKSYTIGDKGEVEILKNINLKIYKGEFLAIVGKSGSGKTTLVNHIGCLDYPTSGEVILEGENVTTLSESELAVVRGRKIGYVFQKFNLIKTLTALENVMLPMVFQGVSYNKRRERAAKLLEMLDMGQRLDFKPNELSGGQQQRIAIARALSNNPEIILADEPTGNLDTRNGIVVMNYLKKLHDQGKTIILVTHDERLAKYAERIVRLADGKIIGEEKNKPIFYTLDDIEKLE